MDTPTEKAPGAPKERSSWSQDEDDFLLANYGQMSYRNISKHLPKRTLLAVASRARKLGLGDRKVLGSDWAKEELEVVSRLYPQEGVSGCKRFLPNRSRHAIRLLAESLGLSWENGPLPNSYTDEELEVLEMYYPDNGSPMCRAFLPHRSDMSITRFARSLGLVRKKEPKVKDLLPQDWDFVKSNLAELGFVECARPLGETPERLRELCVQAGIDCDAIDLAFMGRDEFKTGSYPVEEKEYIRRNYFALGALHIAYKTGRSPAAVARYAKGRLGLTKPGPVSLPPFTNLEVGVVGRRNKGYSNSCTETFSD